VDVGEYFFSQTKMYQIFPKYNKQIVDETCEKIGNLGRSSRGMQIDRFELIGC
jgi:hypothetical protein